MRPCLRSFRLSVESNQNTLDQIIEISWINTQNLISKSSNIYQILKMADHSYTVPMEVDDVTTFYGRSNALRPLQSQPMVRKILKVIESDKKVCQYCLDLKEAFAKNMKPPGHVCLAINYPNCDQCDSLKESHEFLLKRHNCVEGSYSDPSFTTPTSGTTYFNIKPNKPQLLEIVEILQKAFPLKEEKDIMEALQKCKYNYSKTFEVLFVEK